MNPQPRSAGESPSTLPTGRTYHVAADGDDANPGTDPQRPLRTLAPLNAIHRFGPGCIILLRGGDTFAGPLDIELDGDPQAPCVLGSYGDGEATLGDAPPYRGAICTLRDSQHLRVERVRFIGTLGDGYPGAGFVPVNRGVGLSITSTRTTGRRLTGIEVVDCVFRHTANGLWIDAETAPGLDGFERVAVRGCAFDEVHQFGCYITGFGRLVGGPVDQLRDVAVIGNRFARIVGDPNCPSEAQALSVSGATGVVIERNRIADCGGLGGTNAGVPNGGSTALGVSNCRDFRIAANEISGTRCSHRWDGSAIDADQDAVNGEIVGNLTYANDGPGIQIGSFKGVVTGDLVIHHNLSIGDSRGCSPRSAQGAIRVWGNCRRVQIAHNTLVVDGRSAIGAPSCISFEVGGNEDFVIASNILRATGGAALIRANLPSEYNATHIPASCRFLGNCYDGGGDRLVIANDDTRGAYRAIESLADWRALGHEVAADGAPLGIAADAGFTAPGSFAPPPGGFLPDHRIEDVTAFDLAADSPCRGRAVAVDAPVRPPIRIEPRDFHGPSTSTSDIGAIQSS